MNVNLFFITLALSNVTILVVSHYMLLKVFREVFLAKTFRTAERISEFQNSLLGEEPVVEKEKEPEFTANEIDWEKVSISPTII